MPFVVPDLRLGFWLQGEHVPLLALLLERQGELVTREEIGEQV